MTNRKLSLISPTLAELLVKQIAYELKNHNLYLSYANYFSVEGIVDLEKYYRKRAVRKNNHHQLIMNYLSNGDFKFTYPAVEENTEKYDDYVTPFKQTIDREILTTQMLYTIYDTAISEKDFMMGSWLYEKLIREQIEEENISRMARTIMEETSDIYLRAEKVLNLLEL
jgi:ferritin